MTMLRQFTADYSRKAWADPAHAESAHAEPAPVLSRPKG